MARAHFVKKARKSIRGTDVKKGDSYWWWKFRFGGKNVSKTKPRRSQLTQSDFYGTIYDIEDEISALTAGDGIQESVEDIVGRLRDISSEQIEKKDNMPESLQESSTGELLQERADACESAADELELIDFDVENRDDVQTEEEFWQAKLEEVQSVSIEAP